MTVKEVIDILNQLDPNIEVCVDLTTTKNNLKKDEFFLSPLDSIDEITTEDGNVTIAFCPTPMYGTGKTEMN